jgi:twitching motility protein PilT
VIDRLPASILIADAIATARGRNASDIHLTVGASPVLRIDGELVRTDEWVLCAADLRDIAAALLGDDWLSRFQATGDVTNTWTDAAAGRMRVHVYAAGGDPAIAIRLLHRSVPTLEALHVPAVLGTLARAHHGILIFAGPTGSGKSTTMAALVDRINSESKRRVVTIEDPIEYRHESRNALVSQREVGTDTPSLDASLRGALRADPDVIVIGEMRDPETIAGALSAALTGHLVLSTLHAGSVAQTVERIVDGFPNALKHYVRGQLANALVAITCQQLVRQSPASGRRVVMEILVATDAVRNLLREAKTHQLDNAMIMGRRDGMQTMAQHFAEVVSCGEVDAGEASRIGVANEHRTVA